MTAAILNGKNLALGVCYYPEHWERADWEPDLCRMKENGISVVRIGEFAWALTEPEEGVYQYALFDDFLETAEKYDMKVIFGTPTATPPAWLTEKYPEALNADIRGNLYRHGGRRHYNYNSPKYRALCRNIVEKFASHYAAHPMVIGWQIDNEINCETNVFYSESDTLAFREFLKKKYGTLEALNHAWGTVFWSETYSSWEEVYVPRYLNTNGTNPHLELDFKRFVSDSACSFAKMQADILRKYLKPGDFITTNGLFGNLDSHRLTRESLDFMMYDSYPNFAYCLDDYKETDTLKDRKWSRNLTETRSISPVFGIMEQQSGANGWNTRMEAPSPKPGQMTLWTIQDIAHGADFVSYFRWRTCTFGTEMYWHGILDYSGRENRRLRELRAISGKLKSLNEVAGSGFEARVAVVKDYDNLWDSELDMWHSRVEKASSRAIFEAAQFTHTPLDFVYLQDNTEPADLQKYDVLFYPHAVILTKERAALLEEYVKQGGKLVMGCRTGYKNITGKCVRDCLPGLASEMTGTDIPEYSFVSPEDGKIMADWGGDSIEVPVFMDMLAPKTEDAKVLATYKNGSFAGEAALISHAFGQGEAYYFGGAFSRKAAEKFLKITNTKAPWSSLLELPECCELTVRRKGGTRYYFVLNYSKDPASVYVKRPVKELLSGVEAEGNFLLEGYGCAVFKEEGLGR